MYKQGDLLLIPVPFSDLSSTKRRPVLVISNDQYQVALEDMLVAAVTSNLRENRFVVALEQQHMREGNLPKPSCIRADKLYTLAQSTVIKKIGSVRPDRLTMIRTCIADLIS